MRVMLSFFLTLLLLGGCSQQPQRAQGTGVVLLVVGDSLTSGYGLDHPERDGWLALVEQQMRKNDFLGADQEIVNASISGETTQGGRGRLEALLEEHQPRALVIELGANDMLRRQSMEQARENLRAMIQQARDSGVKNIGLLDVDVPLLAGLAGGNGLRSVHEELAEETGALIIDYPLAGLYGKPGMMLEDRLHPSQAAQPELAKAIEPGLMELLGR